jgi:hypothetical protein
VAIDQEREMSLHPLFTQILSAHLEHKFDRALASDAVGRPEREYEAPDLTPVEDRSAIRCSSISEAIAMRHQHPDRIVIVCSTLKLHLI